MRSCYAVKHNFGPNTIIGGIRDGASVNGAALRQLKFFYSNLFDGIKLRGCPAIFSMHHLTQESLARRPSNPMIIPVALFSSISGSHVFSHNYTSMLWLPDQQPSLLVFHKWHDILIPTRVFKDPQHYCYRGMPKDADAEHCFFCGHHLMQEIKASVHDGNQVKNV